MTRPPAGAPPRARSEEALALSLDCVHCGLCLSACPTYRETGREQSSPRGRVYLFRGVAEGRIPLSAGVAEEAHLCLGCRACETACPSGVRFGRLLELARADVAEAGLRPSLAARIERLALRHLLPHPRRLHTAVELLALVQALGLTRLARRLAPQLPVPRVPSRSARRRLPERTPAVGERRGSVAFFVGCVMPELFGDVNHASVRVLARNGFDVFVPPAQGCCGALHAHAGLEAVAHDLARRNLEAFAGVDRVVVNSAGCGAALRDLPHWLPGEGEGLAERVRDVCELLDEVGLRAPGRRLETRVCYDDPCHLVHGQGVSAAPRNLLRALPGVTLVDHADASACCGSAGTYNLTQPRMSQAVAARKLDALAEARPDVVATGNPGCLMQLASGAARRGLGFEVVHPISLIDQAYA